MLHNTLAFHTIITTAFHYFQLNVSRLIVVVMVTALMASANVLKVGRVTRVYKVLLSNNSLILK